MFSDEKTLYVPWKVNEQNVKFGDQNNLKLYGHNLETVRKSMCGVSCYTVACAWPFFTEMTVTATSSLIVFECYMYPQ
jgi:hypothetical protein